MDCVKKRKDNIVLMMAMQANAPGTPMGSSQLLPLLMMKDGADNEQLIIFMSMMGQLDSCGAAQTQITQPLPVNVEKSFLEALENGVQQ